MEVFRLGGSASTSATSSLQGLRRNPLAIDDDGDFLYQGCDDLKIRFWSLHPVGAAVKKPFTVLDSPQPPAAPSSPTVTEDVVSGESDPPPSSPSTASTTAVAALGAVSSWSMLAKDSVDSASVKDWIPRPIYSRRWQSPGQPATPLLINLVGDEIVFYRGWR